MTKSLLVATVRHFKAFARPVAAVIVGLASTGAISADSPVLHPLPPAPGSFRDDRVQAISADGSTFGGVARSKTGFRPAVWNAQNEITLIGDSQITGAVRALSADGTIALGRLRDDRLAQADQFFRWSALDGLELLGMPASSAGASAFARDASSMAGTAVYEQSIGPEVWQWRYGVGFQRLGRPAGYVAISVTGCSRDGSVIVGEANNGGFNGHLVWRWTSGQGFQQLDTSAFGDSSPRVSANGDTVVWWWGRYLARWSGGPDFELHSVNPSQPAGIRPLGLSEDGQIVAGTYFSTLNGIPDEQVFRWSRSGFELLGRPAGSVQLTSVSFAGPSSSPVWISSDGERLIGYASYTSGARSRAWTWNASTGFQVDDAHEIGSPNVASADGGVLGWYLSPTASILGAWRCTLDADGVGQVAPLSSLLESSATRVALLAANGGAAILTTDNQDAPARIWRWTPASGLLPIHRTPAGGLAPAQYISADGGVLAGVTWGSNGYELWRWTEFGGPEVISMPSTIPPNLPPNVSVLSADGSTMATFFLDIDFSDTPRGFIWRRDTGFISLGLLKVTSLSADGRVAAGVRVDEFGTSVSAFVWRQTDGAVDLLPTGQVPAENVFVSADGQVVSGVSTDVASGNRQIFRWTRTGALEGLGFLPGYQVNDPTVQMLGISADGSTLVGRTSSETWKWTRNGIQVQSYAKLAPDSRLEYPTNVSEDGTIVHGEAVFNLTNPAGGSRSRSWRWTASAGKHWISDDFSPLPTGWDNIGIRSDLYSGLQGVSSDGSVVAGTVTPSPDYLSQGWLIAYRPVLERVVAVTAAESGEVPIVIYGVGFKQGATAYLEGASRAALATTYAAPNRINAVVPAASVAGMGDFLTLELMVENPDGSVSKPIAFAIANPALNGRVGAVDTEVALVGESKTTEVLPAHIASAGVSATLYNNDLNSAPASVAVALYTENPTGAGAEVFDAGGYVDLQVAGADPTDSLTASFFYPSELTGIAETELVLMYFNGTVWAPVKSSGAAEPIKVILENRFIVVFDATSVPMITELSGTVFGATAGAPTIKIASAPAGPVCVGIPVHLGVQYTASSPASITVDWGDGHVGAASPGSGGASSASHAYTSAGVYVVTTRIVDQNARQAEYTHRYVVVYDPSAGFVTGGGSIDSPAGAYPADPGVSGRATFGFVAKYQKGKTVPTGQTQFQFHVPGFRFNSEAYDWLVVSGPRAQFKGVGTVNGKADFAFIITVTDGQVSGGGGVDKFRIKIWNRSTGEIVYDNSIGAGDELTSANPQAISSGSIVIQKTQ